VRKINSKDLLKIFKKTVDLVVKEGNLHPGPLHFYTEVALVAAQVDFKREVSQFSNAQNTKEGLRATSSSTFYSDEIYLNDLRRFVRISLTTYNAENEHIEKPIRHHFFIQFDDGGISPVSFTNEEKMSMPKTAAKLKGALERMLKR
jgi:hypothetical protein